MIEHQTPSSAKGFLTVLVSVVAISAMYGIYVYQSRSAPCDPNAAEARLATYDSQGIRGTNHPPSLSNLLWVHVGPKWHALPQAEKLEIDKIVRCAATTLDDQGQPTWQAAYYDHETGKLAALTSKRYGFRLKTPKVESTDDPE